MNIPLKSLVFLLDNCVIAELRRLHSKNHRAEHHSYWNRTTAFIGIGYHATLFRLVNMASGMHCSLCVFSKLTAIQVLVFDCIASSNQGNLL